MVYVFKTSVSTQTKAKTVNKLLGDIQEINRFNFDLEDRDNILRIEADNLDVTYIINILKSLGFDCKELE